MSGIMLAVTNTELARQKRADLSLILMALGITLLFLNEILNSLTINYMVIFYTGYFILFLSLLLSLYRNGLTYLKRKYVDWLLAIWLFAAFMLLYGIWLNHDWRYISHDIWPFTYFSCFLVAAKKENWKVIDGMICFHFTIAIALVLYIWTIYGMNITREILTEPSLTWQIPSLYRAWGLLFGWPYMFLTYKTSSLSRKILTIGGMAIFFLLALIILKRNPFIILALFITLALLLRIRGKHTVERLTENKVMFKPLYRKLVTAALIAGALWGGFLIYNLAHKATNVSYLRDVWARVDYQKDLKNTLLENPRLSTVPLIVEQAECYEIFFGQGLGSTVPGRRLRLQNTYESGLFSLFLKGGVTYVIIWYLGFLSIGKQLFSRKESSVVLPQLIVVVFVIMSPISCLFDLYPRTGYLMLWLGRSMGRE